MKKEENKLISLKEAAKISGYSADYIGQLIRQGKIAGKQVYINVAWMTTAEAVLSYKNRKEAGYIDDKKLSFIDKLIIFKSKIFININIIKLFFQTFKSAMPITIIIVLSLLMLNIYIFYSMNNKGESQKPALENQELFF